MRRIIVFLILMSASSPVQADSIVPGEFFTPYKVFLNIGAPVFANGTNQFCWQCDDGNPSNDLQLLLGPRLPSTLAVEGFPTFFTADSLGEIAVNGPAANFAGLNVSFSFRVTTTITTKVNPNHSLERLPQPSVAEGVINGAAIGLRGRELELHYSGSVDGVTMLESSIDPFVVPPEGGTESFFTEFLVDEQVPYTPGPGPGPSVVPDPASLLLLGSGLSAAAIKMKRVKRQRANR